MRDARGTIAILAVVSAVSLIEFVLGQPAGRDWLTRALGGSIQDVSHGQLWRLLSAAFVNPPVEAVRSGMPSRIGIAAHFVPNAILLWVFGSRLEARIGTRRLLLIAVVSQLAGEAWLAVPFPRYHGHGGGTSIVMAGIGGALAILVWSERHDGRHERKKAWLVVVLFALALLTAPALSAGNNHVHAAGFVAGATIGHGINRNRFREAAVVVTLAAVAIVAVRVLQLRY